MIRMCDDAQYGSSCHVGRRDRTLNSSFKGFFWWRNTAIRKDKNLWTHMIPLKLFCLDLSLSLGPSRMLRVQETQPTAASQLSLHQSFRFRQCIYLPKCHQNVIQIEKRSRGTHVRSSYLCKCRWELPVSWNRRVRLVHSGRSVLSTSQMTAQRKRSPTNGNELASKGKCVFEIRVST
jgi:hypothetical protein